MNDDVAQPPPVTPPPVPTAIASPPPRCPQCTYLLEGSADAGTCPECGAAYASVQRFEYAAGRSFGRSVWAWCWPIFVSPALLLFSAAQVELGVFMMFVLMAACLVNASVLAFRRFKRRRLLQPETAVFVPSFATYAMSIGCGTLVFAASFVLVFGVSCGILLMTFAMPGGH